MYYVYNNRRNERIGEYVGEDAKHIQIRVNGDYFKLYKHENWMHHYRIEDEFTSFVKDLRAKS